jgi:hypothetical protein
VCRSIEVDPHTACKALKFHPKFAANTAGAAHPNGPGASFHVRVLAKEGPSSDPKVSTEANIKRVEVQLPKGEGIRLGLVGNTAIKRGLRSPSSRPCLTPPSAHSN